MKKRVFAALMAGVMGTMMLGATLVSAEAETPELKQARLLLAEAARQGIENALRILKITCPEKM